MQAKDVDEALLAALIDEANEDGRWAMVWDLEAAMPDVPPKVIRARLCSMIRRGVIDGCDAMHNCRGDYYLRGSQWDWDDNDGS
jgi:hypothetical protein